MKIINEKDLIIGKIYASVFKSGNRYIFQHTGTFNPGPAYVKFTGNNFQTGQTGHHKNSGSLSPSNNTDCAYFDEDLSLNEIDALKEHLKKLDGVKITKPVILIPFVYY